ncbi:MAG: hypothetical protein AMXMBFR37_15270 [Steroidobacteraceae bacterium]
MRNITISLNDETAAWARRLAGERNTSVSALVTELLEDKRRSSEAYQAAKRDFFSRTPTHPLSNPGDRYPTREELYDRPVLRRR